MKKIKFTCTNCQAKLRVPDHLAGVSAPCPKCGETITAPSDYNHAVEDAVEDAVVSEPAGLEPAHAGLSSQASQQGASAETVVVNETVAPRQAPQARARVVSSSRLTAVPREEVEDPVESARYGKQVPIPIPPEPAPEPAPEELADAAIDEEQAAAETAPEVHVGEVPASLDDIALPEPVSPPAQTEIPATPPAIQKTQPIHVSARPANLPEPKVKTGQGTADLPRLDVSLGEQNASDAAAEMLSPDGISPKEPTKVQLPTPGASTTQYAPDDFIVPGDADEALEENPQQEAAPPLEATAAESPVEYPATGDVVAASDVVDLSTDQFETPDPQPVPAPAQEASPEEPSPVSELLGLDGFDPDPLPKSPPVTLIPAEQPGLVLGTEIPAVTPALELPPLAFQPEDDVPVEVPGLDPSVTLQESAHNFEPNAYPEPTAQPGPQEHSTLSYQGPVGPLSQNPIAASLQVAPVEPAAAQGGAAIQKRSEADVLDDMFGGSESGSNFSLNVKLLIIAGFAVLATVAVLVIADAMGGWSVPDPANVDSTIKPIAPEKVTQPEQSEVVLPANGIKEPSIDDAPTVVDPVAADPSRVSSTIAMPGDTSTPVKIMDSSGSPRDPVKEATDLIKSAQEVAGSTIDEVAKQADSTALSFDEKVQNIVNGNNGGAQDAGMSVIGGAAPSDPLNSGIGGVEGFPGSPAGTPGDSAAEKTGAKNYNPQPTYPAPLDEAKPLGKTHELIDAFLRAPDMETRLRYTYQGDSLKPAVESYYQKWENRAIDRFSLQLFQMESDPEMGGPYWVYLISSSDVDQGFPLIVRVEDGNLKVDWEIFSEFYDRHFVRFRSGQIPGPATFRLVIERMSDYYGADRDGFTDLDDYFVYQINPPYGDLNEFSEYAFVKKDSEVAKQLDAVVGLGEEPLAVIVTLDKSSFAHGIKHFVISEYVTEGWFR